MARDAYLDTLNQFFDCMVEPIVEHGGAKSAATSS
jgi:hypothetical protein